MQRLLAPPTGNFWITDPKVISLLRHLERVLLSPSYLFHLDLELMNLIMMIMLLVFHMKDKSYVAMFPGQVVGVDGIVMQPYQKQHFLDPVMGMV